MENRLQVLGARFKGKIKSIFSRSLAPNTYNLTPASRGFSLVEMVVSVALFAIIMLVAVGALLSLVDANRKARALESVMNNLNISLDSMIRAMRMGSVYVCGYSTIPFEYTTSGADCSNGGTVFSFAPYGADPSEQSERVVYEFDNGRLYRSQNGGVTSIAITAPEVLIEDMAFYTIGTEQGDVVQPKVVVVVKGSAEAENAKSRTTFYIQATAVQRILDI